jgi:peptidyl-prolyl cis-trans isomerase C
VNLINLPRQNWRPPASEEGIFMLFARINDFAARLPLFTAGTVLLAVLSTSAPAVAQSEQTVIARVGGVDITERDLAFATADLGEQFSQVPEESRKAAILNALVEIKLMAAEAAKAGMDKEATFNARMQFLRERALHNIWFQEKALKTVTDEDIKARFEKEIAATTPQQEVRALHILVKSKEEADAIIAELAAGKDFSEIAKAKSIDPSGATNGGDLGFFAQGQMVPEFEAAAFALKVGEYTKEPVKTQFGFHVIRKEEERTMPLPKLEEVEGQVRQIVIREKYGKLVEETRKAAKIEILDEKLKAQIEAAQAKQ